MKTTKGPNGASLQRGVSEQRRQVREIAKAWKRVTDIGPKLHANRLARIRLMEEARRAVDDAQRIEKQYAR